MEDAAARTPFYQDLEASPWPPFSHTDDDIEAAMARLGDPFAGRAIPGQEASVLVQATRDLPVFWTLGRRDLSAMARSLADTWRALGVAAGQRVVLYDYATSPLVLFASRSFLPHLDHGAAEILSSTPICNDGLPELADRCAHILEYLSPSFLFIDLEAVEPLLDRIGSAARTLERIVVSSDENLISPDQMADLSGRFGLEVVQLIRSDIALFFAPPCSREQNTFHPPSTAIVETVSAGPGEGRVSITNTAIASSLVVRYVTPFKGNVQYGQCRCGHDGTVLVVS